MNDLLISQILNAPTSVRRQEMLDHFFASVGQGINAYTTTRSRLKQIEDLYARSDDQLSEMGIAREDIPRLVFQDLLSL